MDRSRLSECCALRLKETHKETCKEPFKETYKDNYKEDYKEMVPYGGRKQGREDHLPINIPIQRPIKRWYHMAAGSKAARTNFKVVPPKGDRPFEALRQQYVVLSRVPLYY